MQLTQNKHMKLDVDLLKKDFPILGRQINNYPLVYFDNGATTQKPQIVIDTISNYYGSTNSNIHRGVHSLSREATDAYEASRKTIAEFFQVKKAQQIIFTAGTTDSINMIAQGLAKSFLKSGDEIILSSYEHHSNILPWQIWAGENKGMLKVIPLKEGEQLDIDGIEGLIGPKTKVLAIAHVSNTLGVISDLARISAIAKKHKLILVVDGAQSAPHMKMNLDALDADFFACSAHKMYGPTGTGILYMKERWLHDLPMAKTGGGTIKTVSFEKTEYAEGALRFEPGTPHIAGVLGYAAALNYINNYGMEALFEHEKDLVNYAQGRLEELDEVTQYGKSAFKAAVISFNVAGAHPFDVGTLLDKYGIAVRTGHHCTQPLMNLLCIPGTVRISFGMYNTRAEIDFFVEKLKKVITMLK
jgi:cysteine desulfurase / selenocysteine lyase